MQFSTFQFLKFKLFRALHPSLSQNDHDKMAVESESFSHSEFMALALNTVSELVKDPLLKDLHSEPSVEEVNSQIALEHGRAITVNVVQQNEENTVLREFFYV
jgi:hypothetical protein